MEPLNFNNSDSDAHIKQRKELMQTVQKSLQRPPDKSLEDKNNNTRSSSEIDALVDVPQNNRLSGYDRRVTFQEEEVENENGKEYIKMVEPGYFLGAPNEFNSDIYDNIKSSNMESKMKIESNESAADEVSQIHLRFQIQKYIEENFELRENLIQVKEINSMLEQSHNKLKRKLEQTTERLMQMEQDNDEQKVLLNDVIEEKQSYFALFRKSEKERMLLQEKLEETEVQVQHFNTLSEELQKITKEKLELIRLLKHTSQALVEKQDYCEELQAKLVDVQKESIKLEETYYTTMNELRKEIKQLRSENSKLLLYSEVSAISNQDSLSDSSNSYMQHLYSEKVQSLEINQPSCSLFEELKSSITENTSKQPTKDTSVQVQIADFIPKDSNSIKEVWKENDDTKQAIPETSNFLSFSTIERNTFDFNYFIPINSNSTYVILDGQQKFPLPIQSRESDTTKVIDRKRSEDNLFLKIENVESTVNKNKKQSKTSLKNINGQFNLKRKYNMSDEQVVEGEMDKSVSYAETGMMKSLFLKDNDELRAINSNSNLNQQVHNKNLLKKVESRGSIHPRRKLSVYYRSFDVSTLESQREEVNFEVRRSMSTPPEADKHEKKFSEESNSNISHIIFSSCSKRYDEQSKKLKNILGDTSKISDNNFVDAETFFIEKDRKEASPLNEDSNLSSSCAFDNKHRNLTLNDSVESIPRTPCFPAFISKTSTTVKESQKASGNTSSITSEYSSFVESTEISDDLSRNSEHTGVKEEMLTSKSDEIEVAVDEPAARNNKLEAYATSNENICPAKVEDSKCPLYRSDRESRSIHSQQSRKQLVLPARSYRMDSSDSRCESDDEGLLDNDGIQKPQNDSISPRGNTEIRVTNGEKKDPRKLAGNHVERVNENFCGASISGQSLSSGRLAPVEKPTILENYHFNNINNKRPKRQSRKRKLIMRRSLSDSRISTPFVQKKYQDCDNFIFGDSMNKNEDQIAAFPSLTDVRLQESGLANLLDTTSEYSSNLSESELECKYNALSTGLSTDRITLMPRLMISIRQRDQSEQNLAVETHKMRRNIQDLAPLCTDRESIERVERVKHQLEMIVQCAHRVSCTAETLGAVHQERRVSRAMLLADKYLQLLRSRCEKLSGEISETKRILMESNIVIEENPRELGDDLPRIRYRSGMMTNNRTMIARRRASIAAISRPLGSIQDVTKDCPRQRNSVSGKVSLRRPSLNSDSLKLESDRLDKTESLSKEHLEEADSRRDSREENNNISRISQPNCLSITSCKIRNCGCTCHCNTDSRTNSEKTWSKRESIAEGPSPEDNALEPIPSITVHEPYRIMHHWNISWSVMFFGIIIFFLGFYVKHVISRVNSCPSYKWWSIEEILSDFIISRRNLGPRPI